ncbi:MAG: DUF2924 domain-containing protein [Phycisphaera sp.]|nr:DUF2924 domain-containing protein [Phycisphaera sp.]
MRTRRLLPVQIDDPTFRAMIGRIERMTPREMRAVFARLFGQETSSGNGAWLRRRIIRRLEEIELSHMMPEALRCAEAIAKDLRCTIDPAAVPYQRPTPSPSDGGNRCARAESATDLHARLTARVVHRSQRADA